ncbi:MAG: hypothetical protein WBQ72_18145 [Terriglobales bacterium]
MKIFAPSSNPLNSPDSFQERLHMYALAASAAGVGMLALAPPAGAEIIYKSANTHIGLNQVVSLDLNGDGAADFNLKDTWGVATGVLYAGAIWVEPTQTENAVMIRDNSSFATALRAGAPIGSDAKFTSSSRVPMVQGFHEYTNPPYKWGCYGPWKNKANRYLGLKFMISGEVHYGWARLTETCKKRENTALLSGYAYETIPNQSITAGRKKGKLEDESTGSGEFTPQSVPAPTPATLGALAKGAAGRR